MRWRRSGGRGGEVGKQRFLWSSSFVKASSGTVVTMLTVDCSLQEYSLDEVTIETRSKARLRSGETTKSAHTPDIILCASFKKE